MDICRRLCRNGYGIGTGSVRSWGRDHRKCEIICRIFFIIFTFEIASTGLNIALAEDSSSDEVPTHCGLAGIFGKTFDPVGDINYLQLAGFVMWDYDRVWRHWAPEALRFKVEGSVGSTISPDRRAVVSVGMLALYYLDFASTSQLRPYAEGGIGVAYTDFQLEDQGSRFNFNPQIGVGTEFKGSSGVTFFASIRHSHLSNGGLKSENRGVNSVVIMIGRYF